MQSPIVTRAHAPEQSATGRLGDGREIVILYIKEFADQCQALQDSGCSRYRYAWFHNEEKNNYILHVKWEDETQIAVRFTPQHFSLLALLIEPKDVIITPVPITDLIKEAEARGDDHLLFSTPIITFSKMVFEDPRPYLYPDQALD